MRNLYKMVLMLVLWVVPFSLHPHSILYGQGNVSLRNLCGKSYALVVGIDQYQSSNWHKLDYAVKDAKPWLPTSLNRDLR